jgi:hypothetical protein
MILKQLDDELRIYYAKLQGYMHALLEMHQKAATVPLATCPNSIAQGRLHFHVLINGIWIQIPM